MGRVSTNNGTAQAAATMSAATAAGGETAPAATEGTTTATPTPADLAAKQQAAPDAATEPANTSENDELPQWARDQIARANRQAAESRVKAKEAADAATQELVEKFGRALGFITDDSADTAPTVDDLQAKLTEAATAREAAEQQTRETALQLALYRNAPKNADVDLLIDSQRFTKTLTDLDPADTDAVRKHVEQFVNDNPRYLKAPPAGASTADVAGSNKATVTPDQFKAMSAQQRMQLAREDRATFDRLTAGI